jgi:hypothetical protein
VSYGIRKTWLGIGGFLLLFALSAAAQLTVGDLSTSLNGILSGGYSGAYGNDITSSHNVNFSGSATANGYYYNPNFVSFNFSPYYGQSRANSNYQSITDASGFNLSSSIFSGSHFPGSVSYATAYNSEGQFAVPGLPNYTTHGNSNTFGINWNELVPGLPTLSVGYQQGTNQYSVYGITGNGNSDFHSFNLNSSYLLAGFNMSASYQTGVSNSFVPEIFNGQPAQTITTDNSGYGFNVAHSLPWNGQVSTSFYHSNIDTNYLGYAYKGNFDTLVSTASIQPTQKLHLSTSMDYTDNLAGVLYSSLLNSGNLALPSSNLDSSHAWDINGAASYSLAANLQAQAQVDRREQFFLGDNFGATSISGGLSYARTLFGGNFNGTFNLIDSMVDSSKQNSLGFSTGVNYSRLFGRWAASGSFNYAQNVSTLLIAYTASYYSYSGNIRRRWGRFNWTSGATFGHSGLTNQPGTNSSNEGYTTSIGYSRYLSLSANYAKSSGLGIITGSGIQPINLPPIIPTDLITMYGGTSYGFSLGSSPIKRLTIAASYAKSHSDTFTSGLGTTNNADSMNVLLQYQFRKVYLTGGYAQLNQGFSSSGLPPAQVSSFYVGISRWFNFF